MGRLLEQVRTRFGVVKVSDLIEAGRSARQIRSLPGVPGIRGVRVVREVGDDARLIRIGAASLVAPGCAVVSGWAAAVLHGVPASMLSGTGPNGPLPVDVSVPRETSWPSRSGLRLRHTNVGAQHRTRVRGIEVTTPARTAMDLARWRRRDRGRLAMLDLSVRFGLTTPEELAELIDPLAGFHGLNALRPLVPLATGLAESVPESELRWDWIEAGLPPPVPNAQLFDRAGRFVARVDLLDPDFGVVGEYQGYVHLIDGAAEADWARRRRLERMNLTVVEIWKQDVEAGQVVVKLRDGYRLARARDIRLDAWEWRPGMPLTLGGTSA